MSSPERPRDPARVGLAYGLLLAGSALFAATTVVGRGIRADIPPFTLSFWRWSVASLVLGLVFHRAIAAHLPVLRGARRLMTELAFFMIGASAVTMVAVHYTTGIHATVVNAMQPPVTALLVWLILRQPLHRLQVGGIALALLGLAAIVSHGDLASLLSLRFNGGDLAMLLSVAGYSMYAVRLPRLPAGLPIGVSLFGISTAGSLLLLPGYGYELATGRIWQITAETITAILFLSVGASILAVYAWNYGNARVGPLRATMFVNFVPVFGAVFSVAFLGEALHLYHFVGAALVAFGVVLVVRGHPGASTQPTA